jgi:hypothetical protein
MDDHILEQFLKAVLIIVVIGFAAIIGLGVAVTILLMIK